MGVLEDLKARGAALEARITKLQRELGRIKRAVAAYDGAMGDEGHEQRENSPGLPGREDLPIVEGMNTDGFSQSLRISHGKARKGDALVRAAVKKNLTVQDLAEKVRRELGLDRLPPSQLSQARRGTRPVRRDVAQAIQRITGFAATRRNWPGGFKEPTGNDV